MDRIDQQGTRPSHLPTATLIAIMAGVTLVAIVVSVGIWLASDHPEVSSSDVLDKLLFVSPITNVTFDQGEPSPIHWRRIGALPLSTSGDLRPSPPEGSTTQDFVGGAIVSVSPVPANQPTSFEVTMRYPRFSPDVIVQVFVTDRPDFSEDRSTSSNELVWSLQEGTARVILPGGRVEPKTNRLELSRQAFTVRIAFNSRFATIDSADKRLFAGAHGLGEIDRYVGVRFLRKGSERSEIVAIQSMRLMKP